MRWYYHASGIFPTTGLGLVPPPFSVVSCVRVGGAAIFSSISYQVPGADSPIHGLSGQASGIFSPGLYLPGFLSWYFGGTTISSDPSSSL